MDHPHPHFVVGQFFQRLLHRFHRALNVGFHDDVQLFHLALLHLVKQVIQRNFLILLELLFLGGLLALLHQFARQALVGHRVEHIARRRHLVQTHDLDRHAGAGFGHFFGFVVHHRAHTADRHTRHQHIAGVQRAVLHQHRRNGAAAFIQPRFDHRTLGGTIGVGFQLFHLGDQQNRFQQGIQALAGFRRHRHADHIAAPLFGNQLILGELLFHPVGIGFGFIHFVDRHHNGNARRFGVVNRFHRLGHNAVVRRDH